MENLLILAITVAYVYIVAATVIFVHELGHALVTWFVGGDIYEIKFGIWELFSFDLGKTKISFGALPIGGMNDTDFAGISDKEFIWILLGGPALNILMFFIIASFLPGGTGSISGYTVNLLAGTNTAFTEFVTLTALFHFAAAAINVIPFPLTDGFHVAATLFGHRQF